MLNKKLLIAIIVVTSVTQQADAHKRRYRSGIWANNDAWGQNSCTGAAGIAISKGQGGSSVSAGDRGVTTFAKGKKSALTASKYARRNKAWRKSSRYHKNKFGESCNTSKWGKNEAVRGNSFAAARGDAVVGSRNGENGASSCAKGNRGGAVKNGHNKLKNNWAANQGYAIDRRRGTKTGYKNSWKQRKASRAKSGGRFGGKGAACSNANEYGTNFAANGTHGSGGFGAHDILEKSCGQNDSFYVDRRGRKRRNQNKWGKHRSSKACLKTDVEGNGYTVGRTDQNKGLAAKSKGRNTKTAFALKTKNDNWGASKNFGVNPGKCGWVGSEGRRLGWLEKPKSCRKTLACVRRKLAKCKKLSAQKQAQIKKLSKQLAACRKRNKGLRRQINNLINSNKNLKKQLAKCRRRRKKCGVPRGPRWPSCSCKGPRPPRGVKCPRFPKPPRGVKCPGIPKPPRGVKCPRKPKSPRGVKCPGLPKPPRDVDCPNKPRPPRPVKSCGCNDDWGW